MDIILDNVGFGFALEFLKEKNDFRYGLRCKEWNTGLIARFKNHTDKKEPYFYREQYDENGVGFVVQDYWFPMHNFFDDIWQVVFLKN